MARNVTVDGRPMQDYELHCPDCGDSMALLGDRYGVRYRCRSLECKGAHGSHPDGKPMGTPADSHTRRARMEAHDAFDRIWRSKKMSRSHAYAWLRRELAVGEDESHIGSFDATMCKKLVQTVRNCYPELFPFEDSLG